MIATILQTQASGRRTRVYETLLEACVNALLEGKHPSEEWLVETAGVKGKVLTGRAKAESASFSDEAKSQAFIAIALRGVPKCPVCHGYLDPDKSMSYDHAKRVREGGLGDLDNVQLMHPYCNQSVKA